MKSRNTNKSIRTILSAGFGTHSTLFFGLRNATFASRLVESELKDGNTLLHHAVRHCNEASEITSYLRDLGAENVSQMAKTVNDFGLLPIDICRMRKNLPRTEREQIIASLLPPTIKSPIKRLSERVDLNDALKRYQPELGSRLHQNLELGCHIANEVRKSIKKSDTHPDLNDEPEINREQIKREFLALNAFLNSETQSAAEVIERIGVGNCGEFSQLAFDYLARRIEKKVPGAIYRLEGIDGRHLFLLIGKDITDKDAVICDPWAGKVYPAQAIMNELGCYKEMSLNNKDYNVLTTYNPKAHEMCRLDVHRPVETEENTSSYRP